MSGNKGSTSTTCSLFKIYVVHIVPTTSSCGTCKYKSEDKNDPQAHINTTHGLYCDHCDFKSEKK